MARHRPRANASLGKSVSYLALGLVLSWPAVAQARPERETASPVTTVDREQIERTPSGRDAASVLNDLPSPTDPAAGSNAAPANVNLRGLSPSGNQNGMAPSSVPIISGDDIAEMPIGNVMSAIFDMHNTARRKVGSEPLQWNFTLAQGAQAHAERQAVTGAFQHSSLGERMKLNFGENISIAPRGSGSPVKLAQLWFNEAQFFNPGAFPNICDGDWSQCGHYSQAIWSGTTDIGCGDATDRFTALVCYYSPPGNMFGQQVLGVPPIILAQGPVINVNNPPPPACQVPEPDDFITLMNQALESQYRYDSPEKGDEATDHQWQLATNREQEIQDRMMKELATLQGNVAKHINDYLAATSAWQSTYSYIASSTTGLQGLLTNWLEAREIYEKADLAFALANLGVGGVKLGFKAYKFFTKPKIAAAGTEAVAGATRVAGAGDEAATLAGAGDDAAAAGGKAGQAGEAGVAATGETQVFNRTLVPPGKTAPTGRAIPGRGGPGINLGADPNVPGFRGYTGAPSSSGPIGGVSTASGASSAASSSAEAATAYAGAVAKTEQALAQAKAAGNAFEAEALQYNLNNLLKQGASGYEAAQAAGLARKVAELDKGLVAAARQAGVNVDNIVGAAADAEAAELAVMRAIAAARGWHDVPAWAANPITNILINARKTLAGVADAKISPQDLELLKSLKTYVESKGLNFADYLATAAGEIGVAGKESFKMGGLTFEGKTFEVFEGIVKYYDAEDINLLLKVLDTGGDAAKLRTAVTPVAQASLNGLGHAAQLGGGGCGALDAGLALNGVGGTLQGGAPGASAPGAATAPGGKPTDAQLENVLYGQGELGKVGLGNVVDQFGVTDRFTAGQGYGRAMLGELWEFITSPSTTTASFYYTLEAQNEMLKLLQNEGAKLVQLGTQFDDASRALRDLQATLERAGLSAPGSYLGKSGPDDLRRALDKLQDVYNSGSDTWKKNHKAEMDGRRNHINEKLAALAETVADLNALAARMQNLRNWLDSLRLNADGSLRGPIDLFNPQVFVRLGSVSLFLRGTAADAFGLTSDVPFRVVVNQPMAQQPGPQPANATDAEADAIRARHRSNPEVMDTPEEDTTDADFDAMRARNAERIREIEEAPEADVDSDFETWLNNLPPDGN